jgi:hypothetical protein
MSKNPWRNCAADTKASVSRKSLSAFVLSLLVLQNLLLPLLISGQPFRPIRSAPLVKMDSSLESPAAGSISLTTFDTAATENFNTLAAIGTSSTVPNGWAFIETGTNANATYTAGTGSGNSGDTYSFGTGTNTDRSFGGLRSGSLVPTLGASLANDTNGR